MKHYRTKRFIDFSNSEYYYGIECKINGKWVVVMENGEVICYETDYEADEMCDILNLSGAPPQVVEILPGAFLKSV